jgi:hypothetical protein
MGVESVYHRNGIATWEVTADGTVNNVQVRSEFKDVDGKMKIVGED